MVFTAQGSVDIGFGGATAAKSFLDAKTLRLIALRYRDREVSGSTGYSSCRRSRNSGTPDQHSLLGWALGSPGMPREIVTIWNEKIKKMLTEDKEFRDELEKVGMTPRWHDQLEVIEVVKKDMERLATLGG